jgi:hypothetical protein
MTKFYNDWRITIILCLTLGLAPFLPEPHILGKIRWLAGGGNGMGPMDYFDLALHGFPFVLLIRLIVVTIAKRSSKANSKD